MDKNRQLGAQMPDWVPDGTRRYLAHTEDGLSIRTLARDAGVHASTVLRQVRRVEMRRDDPLVDKALTALARTYCLPILAAGAAGDKAAADDLSDCAELARDSCRILRRLCETGAVLAVAEQMEKAVVVRDTGNDGAGARTAVVGCGVAQTLALQEWISCDAPGRISRYRITAAGRAALARMLAAAENSATPHSQAGFGEAPTAFSGLFSAEPSGPKRSRRARYNAAESPLCALARRKDRDGKAFLNPELVQAGERLREDFELAQMGPRVTRNWDQFLTGDTSGKGSGAGEPGTNHMARERMAAALGELGPGLSDVALRCCCYLEGLELAEKRMGWSARSGKIVLRIALQRLQQHYTAQSGHDQMIG